jgi:hypothetical protein
MFAREYDEKSCIRLPAPVIPGSILGYSTRENYSSLVNQDESRVLP